MSGARAVGHLNDEGHLVIKTPNAEQFVFWAGSCGDPECGCEDIIMYPVEEQCAKDEYLDAVDELRIDPNTGLIRDDEGEELDPKAAPFLRALDDALTGDMLEALVRRWHEEKGVALEKGKPRTEMIGIEDWTIDDPVAWEQMFDPLRSDEYLVEDATYSAMELYNLNPANETNEVMIDFVEVAEDEKEDDVEVGLVIVKLGGGVRLEPEQGEAEVLDQLWNMYQRRHPDRTRLHERARIMRRMGVELLKRS